MTRGTENPRCATRTGGAHAVSGLLETAPLSPSRRGAGGEDLVKQGKPFSQPIALTLTLYQGEREPCDLNLQKSGCITDRPARANPRVGGDPLGSGRASWHNALQWSVNGRMAGGVVLAPVPFQGHGQDTP